MHLESIMESDGALRSMPLERQSEEDLLGYSLKHKSRRIFEPEFTVVIRMPREAVSLSVHYFMLSSIKVLKRRRNALPVALHREEAHDGQAKDVDEANRQINVEIQTLNHPGVFQQVDGPHRERDVQ